MKLKIKHSKTSMLLCRFGRPVRCVLERNEDMMMTGGRHPYYSKYKVTEGMEGKGRS